MGRQLMFRWGKRTGMKFLPGIPRCWFRGAPLIIWIAGMAVHDLSRPDSRIRAFARRLLGSRRVPQRIRTIAAGPATIEGTVIPVLEKRANGQDK
jgi:hypothetical protein